MDFSNGYTPPNGSTIPYSRSLYILGESSIGQTNTPVLIRNLEECISKFGTGTLTKAWYEANQVSGDSVNIYVMRINGTQSELAINGFSMEIGEFEAIKLVSDESGDVWNEVGVLFSDDHIQITNPESIGGYGIFSYDDYKTIGQLVSGINYANSIGALGVKAYTNYNFISTDTIRMHYEYDMYQVFNIMCGSDDTFLSKNELHDRLDVSYNILEGQQIDIITVVGAYLDDVSPLALYNDSPYGELFYNRKRDYLSIDDENKYKTFHGQLIGFCNKQMKHNILTHAVMAFNPVESVEDILNKEAYLVKAATASPLSDRLEIVNQIGGDKKDLGKYLSVVIGEVQYDDIYGKKYYNNAYISYASTLASRLTSESVTNMVIPNISKLRYHLEDKEIESLSHLGAVTFRKSVLKDAIVISNGVTTAMDASPFHIVSNVRMLQLIMSSYNATLEQYVGENVDRLNATKAMHKSVEAVTKALISDGVAKDIKAELEISAYGVAVLKLSIMCNYSIEYVSASTHIKL